MGQKVHPIGFRLGYIYDWQSKWFAEKHYTELLHGDLSIRRTITDMLPDAAISRIDVERNANQVTVAIHTARPGIVIGRGGQRVDEIRARLEEVTGQRIRVNINEIRMPELEASLVARAVAEQMERRVAHRRAMKQAVARTMQRGALGIKIRAGGRLGGSEMSRKHVEMEGRVPLHTLRAQIDYGTAEARTTLGRIGIKVWIYKGDAIREKERPPAASPEAEEEGGPAAATEAAAEEAPEAAAEEATPEAAVEEAPEALAEEEAPEAAAEGATEAAVEEAPEAAVEEAPEAAKEEQPAEAAAEGETAEAGEEQAEEKE
ncbi:MAG: 30S ribosomal protein S3 [Chloroflexi bacterium]|nr:30S ribosomal protein S3 [Chloroflexota bacterium]